MKKLLLSLAVLSLALGLATWQQKQVHSNTSGSIAGYSGSPDDARTCGTNGGCHGGGSTNQPGWITSDIPANGYVPGETYSISASVMAPGVSKFGFQVSPQDNSGNLLGTMIPTSATQLVGSGKYITHVFSSTSGTNSKTWTFDWTAPAAGTGDVTFYGAFNASNGNNATSGDQIFDSELTVSEDLAASTNESEALANQLVMFPNPVSDQLTVALNLDKPGTASMYIRDLQGRLVHTVTQGQSTSGTFQQTLNVQEMLAPGFYLLEVEVDGVHTARKFSVR